MNAVSVVLSIAELVLVLGTLGRLLVTVSRGRRPGRWWIAATLVTALTVAQPLGIVAHRAPEPTQTEAGASSASSVHVARLFGVPLMQFVVYSQSIPLAGLGENSPQDKLKVRSWAWGPLLTNATTLTDECDGTIEIPCWNANTAYGEPTELTLADHDGWYLTARASPQGSSSGTSPQPFSAETWKLSIGIASPLGLIYWIIVAWAFLTLRIQIRPDVGSHASNGLDRDTES